MWFKTFKTEAFTKYSTHLLPDKTAAVTRMWRFFRKQLQLLKLSAGDVFLKAQKVKNLELKLKFELTLELNAGLKMGLKVELELERDIEPDINLNSDLDV